MYNEKTDNLLRNKEILRFEKLPLAIQQQLEEHRINPPDDCDFKTIKRSRKPQCEGDVFLFSPCDSIYFYGKVIRANIAHISDSSWYNGANVIFIFRCKTEKMNLDNYEADYNNLLLEPLIVPKMYWTSGKFFTIANIPLPDEEKNLDFGFFNSYNGKFYHENGTEMLHTPKIFGDYSIATLYGVPYNFRTELIIDKTLLDF